MRKRNGRWASARGASIGVTPEDADHGVLVDPDGNRFCVVQSQDV